MEIFLHYGVLSVLSLACAFLAVRNRFLIWVVLTCLVIGVIFLAAYMLADYFTGQGINEAAIYHIPHILTINVIKQFWKMTLLSLLALIFLLLIAWSIGFFLMRCERSRFLSRNTALLVAIVSLLSAMASLVFHPGVSALANALKEVYSLRGPDLVSEYIRQNKNIVEPVNPKSFVYIYLESVDRVFLDEKRFPGLMPHLRARMDQAIDFRGIYQAPMAGWTMAGIVSSQCGLPLARSATANKTLGEGMKIECLGDFLSPLGYHLGFMGGADVTFAGKGDFFLNHGFDEIYGSEDLDKMAGRDLSRSLWGVYDDDLLDLVFRRFEAVAKRHERFGLVTLTLDTHPPVGHKTPACKDYIYGDGESQTLNAVYCTDKLLHEFMNRFFASPYSRDVVLIVSSDHLMMANDAAVEADNGYRENILLAFNTGQPPTVVRREAAMMDVAPTWLELVGFEAETLNMGSNLLQQETTLMERWGKEEFYRLLKVWRANLWDFWNENFEKNDRNIEDQVE